MAFGSGFLENMILSIPAVVVGFSMHEFAHALVAHKLGDPTPERDGRLTINPKSHLEPLGFILLLVAGFGWAKGVRINPSFFKNPRRDQILVSLAGVCMNLLIAVVFVMLISALRFTSLDSIIGETATTITYIVLARVAELNIVLLFFNLIPIAPLDGFKVLAGILPTRFYSLINFLDVHGPKILMGLVFASFIGLPVFSFIISTPTNIIMSLLFKLFLIN